MWKNLFVFIVSLHVFDLYSQNINHYSGTDKVVDFANEEVVLKLSWIKSKEELNSEFVSSLEPDRLLHNFRVTAQLPSDAKPLEGWESPQIGLRGHFVGHYLSTLAVLVVRNDVPLLAKKLEYMIDELYKCQQKHGNGYLSAFPADAFDTLEREFGHVWAPYYPYHKIMQGLLDVFNYTHNSKAYDMLNGMADYVYNRMSKLDKERIRKMMDTTHANPQNEMGGMNEVMYKLYNISKNPNHLFLAEVFNPDWFLNSLSHNENILSGLHSNTHIVLVNGFAEGYSTTKEKKYKDAAINFWDMLMGQHAYANGTSSGPRPNAVTKTSVTAEHWGNPEQLSNTFSKEIAESCVSHNTQKLTSTLFKWTAAPKYADAYMNLFYNGILPTQGPNHSSYLYHLPLGSPRNKKYLKENDFACCSGTGIEAFAKLNSSIYFHNDSALWVNLYIPSEVRWRKKNVILEQIGNFPKGVSTQFIVSSPMECRFSLNLFIPSWAEGTDVYVNEEKVSIKSSIPQSYFTINRLWHDKDVVKVVFNCNFHLKPMIDNKNMFAIFYGPLLLAFESNSEIILKGRMEEDILNKLKVLNLQEGLFQLENDGKIYSLRPLYDIDKGSYGVYATIRNSEF